MIATDFIINRQKQKWINMEVIKCTATNFKAILISQQIILTSLNKTLLVKNYLLLDQIKYNVVWPINKALVIVKPN